MNTVATKTKTIRDLIEGDAMKKEFEKALPKICPPERFIRVALTTLNKTPKLAQCDQKSLLACMMDCAALGIEPDGRRAYLIPYGNEAKLIIGYQGLIELARRSGEISMWKAELVCENDKFSYEDGAVKHRIDFKQPRGGVYAVYSVAKYKDGTLDYEVMTLDEIEGIRDRSKAGKSGPWQTDFTEMAKKTVIRRHAKRMPLSTDFNYALQKDEDQIAQPMKYAEAVSQDVVDVLRKRSEQDALAVIEAEVVNEEVPQ